MKLKTMTLLAALLAALTMTAACSSGATIEDDAAAAGTDSSTSSTPVAEEDEPDGPTVVPFGAEATITELGTEVGTLSVPAPTVAKKEPGAWGMKPENGVFWIIRPTYKATDRWDTNPWDWAIIDADGQRYDLALVTELGKPQLDALTLNAGEKNKGAVVIDAPKDATTLVYAPTGENLAQWDLR